MRKIISWTPEAEDLIEKLIRKEGDAPSQSDMIRRLIFRAAGLKPPPKTKTGRKAGKVRAEVTQLGLTAKTQTILLNQGIETVDQLKSMSIETLPDPARGEVEVILRELI